MKRVTIISAAVLIALMSAPAFAAAPSTLRETAPVATAPDALQYAQRQISPREAKSIALSGFPGGEVVDIRRSRDTYLVRIIAGDGRVIDIVVDANTGRIR